MRLIDKDALADALFEKRKNYPQWVSDVIGNMPIIDAVSVVRCKDCKHSVCTGELTWCAQYEKRKPVPAEWFCPGGRKRDE